jgi:outer membrane murein-binding lipoprotein Lpp
MQKSLSSSQSTDNTSSGSANKSNKKKKDSHPPDKSEANDMKKVRADSVPAFLAELALATMNSLSKTDLISRLFNAVDLLVSQFVLINDLEFKISRISDDRVSDLESKVSRLSDDLDNHADQIKSLEEKVV